MTSITHHVWDEINKDVIVRRALAKDIVSMKALAIHLLRTKRVDASVDALISAIRRYKEEQPLEAKYERAQEVLQKAENIRITTNLVVITLQKTKRTPQYLEEIFKLIKYDEGDVLFISQGEDAIKLITHEKRTKDVLRIVPSPEVLFTQKDVAKINLKLPEEAIKTPGIISFLSTELTINNINILQIMSGIPEVVVFVKDDDVVKSYEIIFGLTRKKGRK
ncbi:hypothetical protein HZB01_03890 [Candidatus Woesearchaeota archaeon]|nr:hypothetical protein [Candidatus Woesearchaeota archaeon]